MNLSQEQEKKILQNTWRSLKKIAEDHAPAGETNQRNNMIIFTSG